MRSGEREPLLRHETLRGKQREDTMGKKVVYVLIGVVSISLVILSTVAEWKPGPTVDQLSGDGPVVVVEDQPVQVCPRGGGAELWKKCGFLDDDEWCDGEPHSSNLRSLCFAACSDDVTWMEHCAWQAVHDMPRVCAGTFQPKRPPQLEAAADFPVDDDDDVPGGDLLKDECSRLAMCGGCDGDPTRDSDSFCSSIVLHYSGDTEVTKAPYARALLRAVDDDLDEWCAALGIERSWSSPTKFADAVLTTTWTTPIDDDVQGAHDLEEPLEIEEHYLYGYPPEKSGVFVKQAYAFWRFVLNGPRATTRHPTRRRRLLSDSDHQSDEMGDDMNEMGDDMAHVAHDQRRTAPKKKRQQHDFEQARNHDDRQKTVAVETDDEQGPTTRRLAVKTRSYLSRKALIKALDNWELKAGALVFLDVIFQAMDTEWNYEHLTKAPYKVASKNMLNVGDLATSKLTEDVNRKEDLDFICVYQHTSNILLRSTLLRKLFAYPEPLVLVLAGDADCRLTTDLVRNMTSHTLIFPNDGACASQVDGAPSHLWWPEGLEGFDGVADIGPLQAQGGFEADAGTVLDARQFSTVTSMRPFLIDTQFSVTPRKHSRVELLKYVEHRGGSTALLDLANMTGHRLRFKAAISQLGPNGHRRTVRFDSSKPQLEVSVTQQETTPTPTAEMDPEEEDAEEETSSAPPVKAKKKQKKKQKKTAKSGGAKNEEDGSPLDGEEEEDDEEEEGGDAASIFALAPAGDTWSSGRVLEALLRGAIPIVDATYLTDGGLSSKGCRNPAKFWREGTDDFPYAAPFVFVETWDTLPTLLRDIVLDSKDRLNTVAINRRLADVREYRDRLVSYLRNSTLTAVLDARHTKVRTQCVETPLDAPAKKQLLVDAADYYSADPNWFTAFHDSPAYPGSGCTTKYYTDGRKTHGAMCFDPRCAPPTVADFRCGRPPLDDDEIVATARW